MNELYLYSTNSYKQKQFPVTTFQLYSRIDDYSHGMEHWKIITNVPQQIFSGNFCISIHN